MNPYPTTEPRPLQPSVESLIKVLAIMNAVVTPDGAIRIKLPDPLTVDWGNILGDIEDQTDLILKINELIGDASLNLARFKGKMDCSTNPNYPAAIAAEFWVASVAGKIGGPSGRDVEKGDYFMALADNAGGTEAAVGEHWQDFNVNIPGLTDVGLELATLATPAEDSIAKIKPDGTVETVPFSSGGGGADLQEVWMNTGI